MDPVIIATWHFGQPACAAGWQVLEAGGRALDAIEAAANVTEEDPGVASVGYGGLPNADGVVELDAAIMDGPTHATGAVAGLSGIRRPISVARRVMERTPHALLVGANARRFALAQGFPETDLLTSDALGRWRAWAASDRAAEAAHFYRAPDDSHDTIGLCALDRGGDLAVGCTTSGLAWKLPGRVGDSPIVGSGLYVDNGVGAAAATGNGDEILKVCLSYRVVMSMDRGLSAQEACEEAVRYLLRKRPAHQAHGAACIALRADGTIGSAATAEGFSRPDRRWQHAICRSGEALLEEGIYVSP
ncbi:MAG: N(4)-(beta-N-acetylglucosaminyl)-L-asparaginase [Chthonomonadales bacterium]|nr:N(4)-(beta-N-acetylglucosaminyl)-L-asparaginase [Chthonomonadales bacterium]